MLDINWEDVYNLLDLSLPYLIALIFMLLIGGLIIFVVRKFEAKKRKFIRSQSVIGMLLSVLIIANLLIFGPFYTLISLATGSGTLTDETNELSLKTVEVITDEGIVLLENRDEALPLNETERLNVFGWWSTNPVYGGTGSGAISDNYPFVSLLEGIENSGFEINQEIIEFYQEYRDEAPEMSPFVQDYTRPEPPASTYPGELMENAKKYSDTALVVLTRTGAEHNDLPVDPNSAPSIWDGFESRDADFKNNTDEYEEFPEGRTYLELSQSERDMLELVTDNFDDVIVIYNGSNAMQLDFINEFEQIKGAVWVAGPGQNGFNSLGKVLGGEVNPSGRTPDVFVSSFEKAPYINNIGQFFYDNMDEFQGFTRGDATTPTFVNYVEGIYVGYKFYETAAEEGLIDYENVVAFPFGHGLSYTTFDQEMSEIEIGSNGEISFDVEVTNTGSVSGKEVVQVYYNPPYINGGIEKASVNLIAFDKTEQLDPGESETVSFNFNFEDMASYDHQGERAYVLDQGDYVVSIRSDSHNVIASETITLEDRTVFDQDNKRSSDEVVATNQLEDAEGDIEYLSREDGFANFESATSAPASYSLSEEYRSRFVYNDNYNPIEHNDESDEMPDTGQKNGLELNDFRGSNYDDPAWEDLLDQMTFDEMNELIALGGYQTAEIRSINKVATTDVDGPAALNNNFTGVGSVGFPAATMIASTWNVDMALEFGRGIGQMAEEMNVSGWYAPGINIHRSPFAGRNFEYYSEDSLLSGKMAASAIQGAKEYGVYAYAKHFALNDQELNRQSMLTTWSNEQATREIYLKPFEIAVKEGETNAIMSAYNYIGATFAGAKSELLNNILRDEWGFRGMVLTDWYGNFGYMNMDQIIRNGGDIALATYDAGTNYITDDSATSLQAMRQATKNILYTVVNSNAYSEENVNAGLLPWQITAIVINGLLAILVIMLEVKLIRNYRKKKVVNE